jgi:hypothetical protein
MAKHLLIALAALVAVLFTLAACGGEGSDRSDGTAANSNKGVDGEESKADEQKDEAGSCDGYTAGKDEVIRTFCGGSAKVDLTVGGDDYTLSGGECATQGGYFSVNIGVVTGGDFTGAKPDYFGSNMPEANGKYGDGDQAFATFAVDGTSYSVPHTTGSHDGDGATFAGKTTDGAIEVTGTITC